VHPAPLDLFFWWDTFFHPPSPTDTKHCDSATFSSPEPSTRVNMNVSSHTGVPVYTISGASTARELPDWLVRKRKRSLKNDPEYANRVELLQDFEFPGASSCVRVSEDGNWVMSTGTYKPQIHAHYLPNLSLSFARHTESHNLKFILLAQDYSKSLHLQTDRSIEFHTQGGCHHKFRIPRYGRDIVYNRREVETLIPAVGVNENGNGEVYRFNMELGRFMKPYEVEVGGDDMLTPGGGALQGGINTGAVNCAAIAESTHNLLAFGTSIGTVEFWDPRSNSRPGILGLPHSTFDNSIPQVTAVEFDRGGLTFAAGDSTGMTYLYDLRSPTPVHKKDQGYGFPIQNIIFLESSAKARAQTADPKILTSDKRVIKIWDRETTSTWTSVEPAVDLNHVEWCPDSGMLLTANEGRQQHAFFIPQLGPAPKWCAFLDNIVEEMAEDASDPNAYASRSGGEVYDNYKFITLPQLKQLNIDHLVGQTSLLRPYMHGFFVSQKLYEEASLISNPTFWEEQRAKNIRAKIEKERESRIRGKKQSQVKLNRKLAERILEREEKNERRKAKRALKKSEETGVDVEEPAVGVDEDEEQQEKPQRHTLLTDSRFTSLFQDEDFEIDENSREFALINPSTKVEPRKIPKGLTAVDEEMVDKMMSDPKSDDSDNEVSSEESEEEKPLYQSKPWETRKPFKAKGKAQDQPKMFVSRTGVRQAGNSKNKSFGTRLSQQDSRGPRVHTKTVVGERHVTFTPKTGRKQKPEESYEKPERRSNKDRRSASGNAFRGM
jgi:ribosome biogenesis protein ENP2